MVALDLPENYGLVVFCYVPAMYILHWVIAMPVMKARKTLEVLLYT